MNGTPQERAKRYPDEFTFWSHHAAEYALGLTAGIISSWIYEGRLRSKPNRFRSNPIYKTPISERDGVTMGELRPLVMAYKPKRRASAPVVETDHEEAATGATSLRDKLKARRAQEREAAR